MKRNRFCGIAACENFRGIKDDRIALYSTLNKGPTHARWKAALQKIEPSIHVGPGLIKLCMFHFNPNDISTRAKHWRLKADAVPSIPTKMIGQFWQGVTPIENPPLVEDFQKESIGPMESERTNVPYDPKSAVPTFFSSFRPKEDMEKAHRSVHTPLEIGSVFAEPLPIISYDEALKRIKHLEEENRVFRAALVKLKYTLDKTVQDSSKKICKICSTKIASVPKAPRVRTRKRPTIQRSFECYICKCQLADRTATRKHLKGHASARMARCKYCAERFTSNELMEWHICGNDGTEFQQIACEYCDQSFQSLVKCAKHLETVHTDRTFYRCQKCTRYFGMLRLRDYHERYFRHHDGIFQCKLCPRTFQGQVLLNMHMAQSHPDTTATDRQYLCTDCGKSFKSHQNLRMHSFCHKEPTIQCPDCPAKFHTIRWLKDHSQSHQNLKFKCNECDKIFSMARTLESHINRVHRKYPVVKRHQCSVCNIKFEKLSRLNRHLKAHTTEKRFECEHCPGRLFKYKGDLTKHLQIHVGDNIYKCDACKQGFRYHSEFRKHLFKHYKEDKDKDVLTAASVQMQ